MAVRSDSIELFNNLSSKITQLLHARQVNDRQLITNILSDFNAINYRYPIVTNQAKAVLVIHHCCSIISPGDTELVQKCCLLISNLITLQNVVVEGRTLTIAVQWCLQALKGSDTDAAILICVDTLLKKHCPSNLLHDIGNNMTLLELAGSTKHPEIVLLALKCIETCTNPSEEPSIPTEVTMPHFKTFMDLFLVHLLKPKHYDTITDAKILTVCLCGLKNVISQVPSLLQNNLGIVLGIVKSFMLYGLKDFAFLHPTKLMPSTLSIPEASSAVVKKTGGKMTKHRKQKNQNTRNAVKNNEILSDDSQFDFGSLTQDSGNVLKTSDSDFSDTEGGNIARLTVTQGRIRQASLHLFLQILKLTERSVMFSYWSSFMPESHQSGKHNLLNCILKETSTRARVAALNVLLVLLSSSKLYLLLAEKGINMSFTPLAMVIGLMLVEIHRAIFLALYEKTVPVLTQALKCLVALVQATPYHKLAPGLLNKVIRNVKPMLYHKDPTIQVGGLVVLSCALAFEPVLPDCREAFVKHTTLVKRQNCEQNSSSDDEDDSADSRVVNDVEIPWLLHRCLRNVGMVSEDGRFEENTICTALKIESLKVLSAMSRNYFDVLIAPYLGLITKALNVCLLDRYEDVRLHAGRTVDFIGQSMHRRSDTSPTTVTFWHHTLPSLISLLQCQDNSVLRAIGCDCLGSMSEKGFEQLPRDRQIVCVTLLFACARDEENNVKSAAARALAVCASFPSLKEDTGFIMDAAEAILRTVKDENVMVRVKASWALGTLSEAIVRNKNDPNVTEELPDSFILKLLQNTVIASKDNDKIKMNTARTLGNLLQIINDQMMTSQDAQYQNALIEGLDVLIRDSTTGSNMKVRWNACHALGNAMKNPVLYSSKANWQSKVFNALTDLVITFRNFKVRINAAAALASPSERLFYGQLYPTIFASLLNALETSQNIEDFSEYQHRDHLVERICLTLAHLITLLSKTDLPCLKIDNYETFRVQMKRVWERLIPEETTILYEAASFLQKLQDDCQLNKESTVNLEQLCTVFSQTL